MIEHQDMDSTFQALASNTRREMLDVIKREPGIPVGQLASHFDVSRIAVMKHLAVLENAYLVVSQKEGRVRRLYFNAVPIRMIYERWTDEFSDQWSTHVADLKSRAESRGNDD